jgi:hypothetical protein
VIALVLEGASQTAAAGASGMDRQRLRDRLHLYNAQGIAGLVDRPTPGGRARSTPAQVAELAEIVEKGLILLSMGSCAGAGSICARSSSSASGGACMSAQSARSFA